MRARLESAITAEEQVTTAREVEIATCERPSEPYLGQLALPGVLLWEGERLENAARRAAWHKLGFNVDALGQLTVFDEARRDPRGFTLSVAMWGVGDGEGRARWFPLDEVPPLAFDHNSIIENWSVTLGCRGPEEAAAFEAFYRAKGQVTTFTWTAPVLNAVQKSYRFKSAPKRTVQDGCEQWTCELKEVP